MKILFYHSLATIILLLTITACNKDVTEAELLKNQLATADSLLKRGGVIKYSVKVISTCNSAILKAKMDVSNAQVTIYQNDSTYTAYTDADGLAIFPNMRVGTAAVNVKLKDHATVDYIADLTPADNLVNLSQSQIINTVRYASTMVPMFPIADPGAATITGKVTAELDLTNTTPEPAPGVNVTAMVNVFDSSFVETYIKPTESSSSSQNAGRILKFAFQDAVVSAVTDDKGIYTLKVPAALNGLPIKLSVQDYQTTQKLYLENDPKDNSFNPGTYNMPVLFSSTNSSTPIPSVKGVYIVIDEPTCPIGYTIKSATLTFSVDANGSVTKVNVLNGGQYSKKPFVKIWNNGINASLDANWDPVTGAITNVDILNSGSGYTSSSYITAVLLSSTRNAKIDPVIENGEISQITVVDKGYGYTQVPNINIITPYIVSEKASIYIYEASWQYELRPIILSTKGKGYKSITNYPSVKINMDGSILLKTYNNTTTINNFYLGTGFIF